MALQIRYLANAALNYSTIIQLDTATFCHKETINTCISKPRKGKTFSI